MTSINPINVNTQGVGSSLGYGAKAKSEEKESPEKAAVSKSSQKSPLAADDVLSFMAQSALSAAPSSISSIDVSKYVDKESAQRIAGFISQFEDKVAEGLANFDKEVNLSDSAKLAVVLSKIDSQA